MMGSMFGPYAPPQGGGGMFGQQQSQSPLMQMLGGGGGGMNPQLLQLAQQLMSAGGPQRMPAGASGNPGLAGMGGMGNPSMAGLGGMFGAGQQPTPMGGQNMMLPGAGQMGMGQQQPGIAQLLQLLGGSR